MSTILTHNDSSFNRSLINGSSKQGSIDIAYPRLVEIFGKPMDSDDYKTDAEWWLLIDGTLVTVYNYKTGVNYLGEQEGVPTEELSVWSVGGNSPDAFQKLTDYIGSK